MHIHTQCLLLKCHLQHGGHQWKLLTSRPPVSKSKATPALQGGPELSKITTKKIIHTSLASFQEMCTYMHQFILRNRAKLTPDTHPQLFQCVGVCDFYLQNKVYGTNLHILEELKASIRCETDCISEDEPVHVNAHFPKKMPEMCG